VKAKQLCVLACSTAALLIMKTANAAMPLPSGWYLEGNVGRSQQSDKSFPGNVKNTGFGWNVDAGYKFTEYVSGEVGFTHYAQTRIRAPNGSTVATDQVFSYDLAGKLTLPVATTGLNIFGKAGISRINSYTEIQDPAAVNANKYYFNTGLHTHTCPYFGAGAEFGILNNLLVNTQWMRAKGTNQTGDVDLYSVGLAYIF
jgi:hypothetical protein